MKYIPFLSLCMLFTACVCFQGEDERLILFKDIQVALAVSSFSVDVTNTSYVVIGDSSVVIQLSLPEQHFIRSWCLPDKPQRVFCTNEGFIAVTTDDIFLLSQAGLKRKGCVPTVADLKETPIEQLEVSRKNLIPLLSSNDLLLWQVASSGSPENEPLLLVWTDLTGSFLAWKSFEGIARAASSIRFSPSGRSAVFRTLNGNASLIVTAVVQVETQPCDTIVSNGYNEEVFLFRDHFSRLAHREKNLAKGEYADSQLLKDIAGNKRSSYILASGRIISTNGSVLEYSDGGFTPYSSLKYCTHDEKAVYMTDPRNSRFVKADILTGNTIVQKAKGIPVFFDDVISAEMREGCLYVNDRLILQTDIDPYKTSCIFRIGKILVFNNSRIIDTNTGEMVEVENVVWSFRLRDQCVFLVYKVDNEEHQLFAKVFDSGSLARSQLSRIDGIKPDYIIPLGTSAYLVEAYRTDSAFKIAKLEVLPDDLSVTLEQVLNGRLISLFPGVRFDAWSHGGQLIDDVGNEVQLPPVGKRNEKSFAMSIITGSTALFIAFDSGVYIRCGCNFLRILPCYESQVLY